MIEQQVRQLMELMRQGQPVELPIPRGTVRKTVRLASIAQQFGYEYADSRLGGGYKIVVTLFVVPDPGPQARARAARNWAQYPNAGDGKSLPPAAPDTLKLLKARIITDLTDKNSEKRLRNAVVGLIVGAGALVSKLRTTDGPLLVVAGVLWGLMMALAGGGLVATRRRWAKCTARLAAAGFVPVTVEGGRVRYLPPGAQVPGQAGPYGPGPYGNAPYGNAPYGNAYGPLYGQQYPPGPPAPQAPYPQHAPGPYAPPQPPGPYRPQ